MRAAIFRWQNGNVSRVDNRARSEGVISQERKKTISIQSYSNLLASCSGLI